MSRISFWDVAVGQVVYIPSRQKLATVIEIIDQPVASGIRYAVKVEFEDGAISGFTRVTWCGMLTQAVRNPNAGKVVHNTYRQKTLPAGTKPAAQTVAEIKRKTLEAMQDVPGPPVPKPRFGAWSES